MAKSIHDKKAKERKPRVHISYEVYVGDAQEMKELPFVLGVMSNLSGHGTSDLPALKEREFTDVNKFTFNEFLSSVKPKLQYKVKDTLSGDDDSELPVDLSFKNMKDFDPEGVVKQIKPLNDLLNIRTNLADLRRRATTSDEVTQLLQNIMDNEDARKAVADKLGSGGGAAADDAGGDDGAAPAEGAV